MHRHDLKTNRTTQSPWTTAAALIKFFTTTVRNKTVTYEVAFQINRAGSKQCHLSTEACGVCITVSVRSPWITQWFNYARNNLLQLTNTVCVIHYNSTHTDLFYSASHLIFNTIHQHSTKGWKMAVREKVMTLTGRLLMKGWNGMTDRPDHGVSQNAPESPWDVLGFNQNKKK